jgi:hypothetical protein
MGWSTSPGRVKNFQLSVSGAHRATYAMGTRGSFFGEERPEREDDHSLPTSAEVKERVYIPVPPYAFMV